MNRFDVLVVGAGIVGLATARSLAERSVSVAVLEKEPGPACHQSGRNSGVIHSGVAYAPGSLKARLVAAGREALLEFCRENGIPVRISGKVIVASCTSEIPMLLELAKRAASNGVEAVLGDRRDLQSVEPAAEGLACLHVPATGVVDFASVCRVLSERLQRSGVVVSYESMVTAARSADDGVEVQADGHVWRGRHLVVCAGVHGDRLADMVGVPLRGARIVPFRGEFREVTEPSASAIRSMVYPVPRAGLPFLGVHLTRGIDGRVHAGPNAVLALAREGYDRSQVDMAEMRSLLVSPAFRSLARRFWRTGAEEVLRSLSPRRFARAVRRLVPDVAEHDLKPAPGGIRAQVVWSDGRLEDDFLFLEAPAVTVALNVPSPAATAAFAIGEVLAGRVLGEAGQI
ncbi:MAG: hydroxyglutarate oxidase [Acidimicrobiales bacterium]|nr:MAG: hydroxyglutarate oxidase [Acidimicrobiales bacterium]